MLALLGTRIFAGTQRHDGMALVIGDSCVAEGLGFTGDRGHFSPGARAEIVHLDAAPPLRATWIGRCPH